MVVAILPHQHHLLHVQAIYLNGLVLPSSLPSPPPAPCPSCTSPGPCFLPPFTGGHLPSQTLLSTTPSPPCQPHSSMPMISTQSRYTHPPNADNFFNKVNLDGLDIHLHLSQAQAVTLSILNSNRCHLTRLPGQGQHFKSNICFCYIHTKIWSKSAQGFQSM